MNFERRTFLGDVEFRAEGKKLVAYGYAAKFNTRSQNLGGFVEEIAPGTFTKTIQEADIRALRNHDPNLLLGRSRSGTLRLAEDNIGLAYEIDLPDTSEGRDTAVLLERGDMTGSSFGFRVIDDEWGETEQGFPLRRLTQVALRDVGPVTFPAYTDAESALRHLADARSLDLELLAEAARTNQLRNLIIPNEEHKTDEERVDDESRANPTLYRRKFAHLI